MDQTIASRSVVQFGQEHLAAMDKVHRSLRGQFHKIVNALVEAMSDIERITPNAFQEVGVYPRSGVYMGALASDAFHFSLTIQFGEGEMSCAVGIRVDLPPGESVALRRDEITGAVNGLRNETALASAFELPEEAKLDRKKALRELLGEDENEKGAPRRERYRPARSPRPNPAPAPSPATFVDPGMVLGNVKKEAEKTPMNGSDSQPQRSNFPYLGASSDPVDCVVALAHAIHPDAAFSYSDFSRKLKEQWPDVFPEGENFAIKALYSAKMRNLIHEINPTHWKITPAGTAHAEKMKTRRVLVSSDDSPTPQKGEIPWAVNVSDLSRGKVVGGIALHIFGRKPFDRDSVAQEAFEKYPTIFETLFNAKNAISGLKSQAYGWLEDAPGGQLRLTDKGFKALAPLVGLAPLPSEATSPTSPKIDKAPRLVRKATKTRVSFDDGPVLERYPDPASAADACKVVLAIVEEVEARKSVRERDLAALDKEIEELEEEARTIQAEVEVLKGRRTKADETIPELEERKKAILKLMPQLG